MSTIVDMKTILLGVITNKEKQHEHKQVHISVFQLNNILLTS